MTASCWSITANIVSGSIRAVTWIRTKRQTKHASAKIFEETGVHCRIVSPRDETLGEPDVVEVLHVPWMVLCERIPTGIEPEHCHIDFAYVCEPLPGEGAHLTEDTRETEGIGWFTLEETNSSSLFPDFRRQVTKLLGRKPVC